MLTTANHTMFTNALNIRCRGRLIAMKLCMFTLIFVLYIVPTSGQTVTQIEAKYGKPTNAYSISSYIWMTPDYTTSGQVCRMRLYPKTISSEVEYLSPRLHFEELNAVLNDLVPVHLRGEKKDAFGLTDMGGGVAWTTYAYEKVTFIFTSSTRLEPGQTHKPGSISFSAEEIKASLPKKTPPSIDDFTPSRFSKTEIVTISWNERRCARK